MSPSPIRPTRAHAAGMTLAEPAHSRASGIVHPQIGGAPLTRGGLTPASAKPDSAAIRNAFELAHHAAPEGTDTELWSVLTPEERGFFARTTTVSAPTYGRGGTVQLRTASAMVRRGLHLDLRA